MRTAVWKAWARLPAISRLTAAVLVISIVASSGAALASPGLIVSTPFTGISVKPGETARLSITVSNTDAVPRTVDVSIKSAPSDWKPALTAGGYLVHQVFVPGNDQQMLDLEFTVPEKAAEDRYRIVLEARSGGAVSTLPLDIKVATTGGSTKLVTDYPALQGPSGAEFRFRLTLSNDASTDQMYSLMVGAPEGWTVKLTPSYSDQEIASLSLKPGASQGLELSAVPPKRIEAGTYPLAVRATSSRGVAEVSLNVTITGKYEAQVTTPSERLNADVVAGRENPVTIVVKNTGSSTLQNVQMFANAPSKWTVTFKPESIDTIPAGESKQVQAIIRPDAGAVAGDYLVTVGVNSKQVYTSADLRVTVRTSTLWGIVGLLVVAGVAAWLYDLFRKYGRR